MVSVLNIVETGHEDMIHGAEMDYHGLRLATCSSDHSVKIFNIKDGTQTLAADLKGHNGPVWEVAWAHPKYGNLLASCSYDRKVIIWKEAGEWTMHYEYSGHKSSVNSVAWAPHEFGLILACGSSDGSISILYYNSNARSWEAKMIPNAHTIGCNAVSWCPFWPTAVVKKIVTGGCDNIVKIWKEKGDRWVEDTKLELHSDWVQSVAWAPSIGLPCSIIASCSLDRRVIIWSSDDNRTWTPTILNTFDYVVQYVSWSSSNILAVSGGDNKVSLWRSNTEGQWLCISEVNKGQGQITELARPKD